MSINDLLGDHTPAPPPQRLTPRAPLSVKELTALLIFGGLIWAAYDKMSKFAEKSSVEKVVETQWLQRLETQHNFDEMRGALKEIKGQLDKAAAETPKPRK